MVLYSTAKVKYTDIVNIELQCVTQLCTTLHTLIYVLPYFFFWLQPPTLPTNDLINKCHLTGYERSIQFQTFYSDWAVSQILVEKRLYINTANVISVPNVCQ